MAKDIVMLHGANAGGWCFERFRAVFEDLGWTCHAPDLIGHGNDATADPKGSPASAWRITILNCNRF